MQSNITDRKIIFDNICKYLKKQIIDCYELKFSDNRIIISYKNIVQSSIGYDFSGDCFLVNDHPVTDVGIFKAILFFSIQRYDFKSVCFQKYFNLLQKSNLI